MRSFYSKFLLLELALVLFGSTVYAQHLAYSTSCSCPIALHSVHMSTQGNEILSSRSDATYSEFLKFNTLLAGRIATIQDIIVSDFDVLNDYVYFCGRYLSNGQTMFGYFKEADINSQTFQATCFELQLDYVSRIKVYSDIVTQKVSVAINGGKYDNYDPDAFAINESDLIVGQINGTNFDYYTFRNPYGSYPYLINTGFNFKIHYTDIVLTDDYIVSVGMNIHNAQEIFLSRIKKTNLGVCDFLTISDPANLAVNTAPIVEKLEGNDVAFTSLYTDVVNNVNYARVYRYDMDNFINTGIQDVALQEKATLDDLLYLPYDQSLLLLSSTSTSPASGNICSSIYYLYPYATVPYTADYMYEENERWISMERMLVSHFVIGGEILYNERMFYVQDKQDGAFSPCHPFTTTSVLIQGTLTGTPDVLDGIPDTETEYYENCDNDDIYLNSDCQ